MTYLTRINNVNIEKMENVDATQEKFLLIPESVMNNIVNYLSEKPAKETFGMLVDVQSKTRPIEVRTSEKPEQTENEAE
jgi:hypothetical protein